MPEGILFVRPLGLVLTVTKLYYFAFAHNLAGAAGHASAAVLALLRAACFRRSSPSRSVLKYTSWADKTKTGKAGSFLSAH